MARVWPAERKPRKPAVRARSSRTFHPSKSPLLNDSGKTMPVFSNWSWSPAPFDLRFQ
jgi:hypothetical protein